MLNVFYRISFGLAVFLVVSRGLLGDEKSPSLGKR